MKAQGAIVIITIIGICVLAFVLPFMIDGGRMDPHDDIIVVARQSATPTPLDRALTRDAFALLFFSPTPLPSATFTIEGNILPTFTFTFTVTSTWTATPAYSSTPTTWISFTPYITRTNDGSGPTAINTRTPTPYMTATLLPTRTLTFTPVLTPTKLPTSTSTSPPTATEEPPTITPTNVPNTHKPDTNTPKPTEPPTDPPPTDPPPTEPPPTEPPPSSTPIP